MIILQTVANLLRDSPTPVQNIQKLIHALSGASSVVEVSVDDILWGYEDDYLVLFDSLFPGLLPTTEFGIFQGVSYTHSLDIIIISFLPFPIGYIRGLR